MSHIVQQKWCEGLKLAMPRFFKGKKVLEMGSLNVNGSLRPLFKGVITQGLMSSRGRMLIRLAPFTNSSSGRHHSMSSVR